MPELLIGIFNLTANALTVVGCGIAIYLVVQVRGIAARMESVIAPKTGIEGFLNMCALVVEGDPDGTCVVDDDGRIVLVNKRLEDISGYHRSELIGNPVEVLVPFDEAKTHRQHREGFVVNPSSRPMRGLRLRHKRGREIPVGINLNRYTDRTGGYTIAKVRIPDDEWSKN